MTQANKRQYSFIAISDVHLGEKLYNIPELYQDLNQLFIQTVDTAIKEQVNFLVIVGDLFDTPQVTPDLIQLVQQQVKRAEDAGVVVIGVTGDHDAAVNNTHWYDICGIRPVNSYPSFLGWGYFNYSLKPEAIKSELKGLSTSRAKEIEWIFLHGQFAQLFPWVEPKKELDFTSYNIFEYLPNLKGIVLGDIHRSSNGEIVVGDKHCPVTYCGSLGVVDISEIGYNRELFCYKAGELKRIPYSLPRDLVKITLSSEEEFNSFSAEALVAKYRSSKNRPVFSVVYNVSISKLVEQYPEKFAVLYSVGFVRKAQVRFKGQEPDLNLGGIINIRAELNTQEKIEHILQEVNISADMKDVLRRLLAHDQELNLAASVLDEFKRKKLENL